MRYGVCHSPRIRRGWEPPTPIPASWRALAALGISEVRLARKKGDGLEATFADDRRNILAAGLTININAGVQWADASGVCIKPDPAAVEAWAFQLASLYGAGVRIWTFDNEPGALARAWNAQHVGGPDFMAEVYMPACIAFVRGVQRAIPDAVFGGCDADSVEIQARFVALWLRLLPDVPLRRRVHPYGELGNMRYATMAGDGENEGFATQADNAPLDIGEIDHQQLPSAIERGNREGGSARGIATVNEMRALLNFTKMIQAKYPGQIDFGTAEYFFERLFVPEGIAPPPETWSTWTWSTWTYGPALIVSDIGQQFSEIFKAGQMLEGRQPGRRH